MLPTLKSLLTSKKAVGLAGAWAGLTPLYIETHDIRFVYLLAGIHAVWLLAQGIADHGKSTALVSAAKAASTRARKGRGDALKEEPEK